LRVRDDDGARRNVRSSDSLDMGMRIGMRAQIVKRLGAEFANEIQWATAMVNTWKKLPV
jgi:hypothetical protein